MSALLLVFGLIDLLAAVSMWQAGSINLPWAHLIGWTILLKGLYSMAMGALNGFYFDVLGWADVLAGGVLLFSWSIPFLWVFVAGKGLYSMLQATAAEG